MNRARHGFLGVAIATLVVVSSSSAWSNTYNYEFRINEYISNDDTSFFGSAADIMLEFSNGGSTNKNQIYTYGDIVGANVKVADGSFIIYSGNPQSIVIVGKADDTFATTDAQGNIIGFNFPSSTTITITDNYNLNAITESYWFRNGFNWAIVWNRQAPDDYAIGNVSTVPEAPSIWLGCAGLAGLVIRRHASCRRSSCLSRR